MNRGYHIRWRRERICLVQPAADPFRLDDVAARFSAARKEVADFFEILPKDFLVARIAQNVGGMDGGHRLRAPVIVEPAVNLEDAFLGAEHGFHGWHPLAANEPRLDRYGLDTP